MRKQIVMMLCGMLVFTACSTAWIGEAEQILAALVPAVTNLLALIEAFQGADASAIDLQKAETLAGKAETDLQLMQSLVALYEKANATAQPQILGQIQNAMNDAQSNLSSILPALNIQDPATQAKVSAVVGLLESELQSVEAVVPLMEPRASSNMTLAAVREVSPKAPLSAAAFITSFDRVMAAKTGNAALDRTCAGLQIHAHGKFARWASVGFLK